MKEDVKSVLGEGIILFRSVMGEVFGDNWKDRAKKSYDWGMAAATVLNNTIDHVSVSVAASGATSSPDTIQKFVESNGGWNVTIIEHIRMWKQNNDEVLAGRKGEIFEAQRKSYEEQRKYYELIEQEIGGDVIAVEAI